MNEFHAKALELAAQWATEFQKTEGSLTLDQMVARVRMTRQFYLMLTTGSSKEPQPSEVPTQPKRQGSIAL